MKSFLKFAAVSALTFQTLSADRFNYDNFISSYLQDSVPGTITGTIEFPRERLQQITIDGTTLAVSYGEQVLFYDVNNDNLPYGSVYLDREPFQLTLSGTLCGASAWANGYYLIDTQTLNIQNYGTLTYGIAFNGTYGALDGGFNNAQLYFIDNLGNSRGGQIDLGRYLPYLIGQSGTTCVAISGRAESGIQCQIFDIETKNAGDVFFDDNITTGIAVSGTLCAITFWKDPVRFVSLDTLGSVTVPLDYYNSGPISLSGTLAVTADNDSNVISILSPQTLLGTLTAGEGPGASAFLNATTCYIVNEISNNITILDLTNPSSPAIKGTITVAPPVIYVKFFSAVSGTCGACLDLNTNLGLFDTQTKTRTKTVLAPNDYTGTGNVAMSGTIGVIGTSKGLQFFNNQTGNLTGFLAYDNSYVTGVALNGTLGAAIQIGASYPPPSGTPISISFFDATKQTLIGSISNIFDSSADPYGNGLIALNGTTGIFSSNSDQIIGIFDSQKQTLIGTYTTEFYPYGVALNGTTGVIGYNDSNAYDISIFDTQKRQFVGTVTVGQSPGYVSMANNYALVSCYQENSVALVDIPNLTVLGSITNLESPTQLQIYNTSVSSLGSELTIQSFVPSLDLDDVIFFDFAFAPPSPTPSGFTQASGNAGVVLKNMFPQLDGNTNQGLQKIITVTQSQDSQIQTVIGNALSPHHKILQFTQEKLDLLLHRDLDDALYSFKKGTVPFLQAGYDHLYQDKSSLYNGYRVNNFYQMFGLTHSFSHMNGLVTLGVSESYLTAFPLKAKDNYVTVFGGLGLAGQHHRWNLGLKGLYEYSFTNTKRFISYFNEKASSSHGMWTASAHLKLSYTKAHENYTFIPYEEVGYLYGQENDYTEHGAPYINLHVKDETVSLIRNLLGLNMIYKIDDRCDFFLDGAWVYEDYLNDNGYKAAFINTSVYGTFYQQEPEKNYGRARTGFKGTSGNLGWEVVYTGLYSKNFIDNAVSLKFDYKF
jgi:hypothetical protein